MIAILTFGYLWYNVGVEGVVMKYKKIDLNEKLFGEGFIAYDWYEDENKIVIYLKSTIHEDKCPVCGSKVSDLHNTYHRIIQSIPVRNKTTYLDVIAYKYDCINEDCERKVIMQGLPFALASQRRTDDLNCLILATSMFLSNEGTSKVLRLLGVDVSNDSVKRLIDRIIIKDDKEVEEIGIDDVAIRKGQSYATSIYDMSDHHLIALLDGRDKDTVVEWLKEHKKIKLVARDRASAYANAISEVLPDCVQVADRFHLLQNLIDKMKDIFKEEIPNEIFIKNGEVLEKEPEKIEVLKIAPDSKELDYYDYNNDEPLDENGNVIKFDKTNTDKRDKQHREHAINRKKNKN